MVLASPVSYWVSFGVLYLSWMTVQDYRKKGFVDDRKNWFMLGLTMSLITHIDRSLWYLLGVSAVVFFLNWFLRKRDAIGEADINGISWIVLGFGIINPWKLLGFFIVFSFVFGTAFVLKRWVFKYKQPQPAMGLLLITFLLSVWLTGVAL